VESEVSQLNKKNRKDVKNTAEANGVPILSSKSQRSKVKRSKSLNMVASRKVYA